MLASTEEVFPAPGLDRSAAFARPAAGAPDWLPQLPDGPREVMGEVYSATAIGLRALPAIGIRTALDLLFADVLGGDRGTFEAKVKLLSAQSFFSATDEPHVIAVMRLGTPQPIADTFPTTSTSAPCACSLNACCTRATFKPQPWSGSPQTPRRARRSHLGSKRQLSCGYSAVYRSLCSGSRILGAANVRLVFRSS